MVQQDQRPQAPVSFQHGVEVSSPGRIGVHRVWDPLLVEEPVKKLGRQEFIPRRIRSVNAEVLLRPVLVRLPGDALQISLKGSLGGRGACAEDQNDGLGRGADFHRDLCEH